MDERKAIMENKLSQILVPKVHSLSRAQMEVTSDDIISSVIDGWEDVLDLDIRLKFMEETIKLARQKIEANVKALNINETPEKYGVKIAFRNGHTVYNLEEDLEYKKLSDKLKERTELLKEVAKSKSEVFITESGEEIKKPSVKSYTKDSISYTFPK
jgi:chromatin segregation and condensation protein Rec8/ScpA/Scc1 (kleisin family)